jgi:hypothetical protein
LPAVLAEEDDGVVLIDDAGERNCSTLKARKCSEQWGQRRYLVALPVGKDGSGLGVG